MKLYKFIVPISIILAGAFIASSIVTSYNAKLEQEAEARDFDVFMRLVNEQRTARIEAEDEKCKALTAQLIKQWNNVIGVTYDDDLEDCAVTFIDQKTDAIETAPLHSMQTDNR